MLCTYVIYSSQFQTLGIIIISNDTNLQIGKEKRKGKKQKPEQKNKNHDKI